MIRAHGGFAILIRTTLAATACTISLTDAALTVAEGDNHVIAWDRGGRLYSVADESRTYRRGLNGSVLVKWRLIGRRQRAWATPTEADATVNAAAALASRLLDLVNRAPDTSPAAVVAALGRAAAFDSAAARDDARRFGRVYSTIGILPPDQYLALVLQATEGCSFAKPAFAPSTTAGVTAHSAQSRANRRRAGGCAFCEFYRNAYRVRSGAEFREHARCVRDYLGDSMSLRQRAVFLGSANALAVPMSGLLPLFDIVADQFPSRPVYAFVDGFTGARKTAEDYRQLAERGLRRVYLGLESGDDALLAAVNKPASSRQAVATVRALKEGGVAAGVIVMIGLGGDRFADAHVRETTRVVSEMHLDEKDLLYFSELVDEPGSVYGGSMAARDVRALNSAQCAAQRKAIEGGIVFEGTPPKVATYDIREFVY